MAGAKLLSASTSGYQLPPDIARGFLGDTATHEVGHIRNAEEAVMNLPPNGIMQDYYAHSNIVSAIFTLLHAIAGTSYRPNSQVVQKLLLLR